MRTTVIAVTIAVSAVLGGSVALADDTGYHPNGNSCDADHGAFRARRDPRAISRGSGDRRAAEPVMRRPANDSRQFELGAGLGVQSLRGRGYPLRGRAAAKLEKPHVGQPVRRCVLPGVSLASGL